MSVYRYTDDPVRNAALVEMARVNTAARIAAETAVTAEKPGDDR